MFDFGATEIFRSSPFIMLEIDAGWPEKLTRFFPARLPNWEWKLEIGNSNFEKSKLGPRRTDLPSRWTARRHA
jgi:hypothetical protein